MNDIDDILDRVHRLNASEREELDARLLADQRPDDADALHPAWAPEIARRAEAARTRRVGLVPAADALERVQAELARQRGCSAPGSGTRTA